MPGRDDRFAEISGPRPPLHGVRVRDRCSQGRRRAPQCGAQPRGTRGGCAGGDVARRQPRGIRDQLRGGPADEAAAGHPPGEAARDPHPPSRHGIVGRGDGRSSGSTAGAIRVAQHRAIARLKKEVTRAGERNG
ncbi:RNA polymerase sigma factor SigD [Rhodococcus pyridinivorans AK37]|uniref:RNA polymerase sigma factor SigD n=1 Tax=Rhodococcus pyridinivorans AK37 TaxID=1114960 RepID=H0JKI8_9NOCA|nr:RNA polymerase sigma factor SigD [Rhodococcus pyridinivorans AK37]